MFREVETSIKERQRETGRLPLYAARKERGIERETDRETDRERETERA